MDVLTYTGKSNDRTMLLRFQWNIIIANPHLERLTLPYLYVIMVLF